MELAFASMTYVGTIRWNGCLGTVWSQALATAGIPTAETKLVKLDVAQIVLLKDSGATSA